MKRGGGERSGLTRSAHLAHLEEELQPARPLASLLARADAGVEADRVRPQVAVGHVVEELQGLRPPYGRDPCSSGEAWRLVCFNAPSVLTA